MKELFPYYSIGDFLNNPLSTTEFEVTLFEEMAEPDVADVHKHTFYEILWVDCGISQQTIDYKSYALTDKSLFFISPGQVHKFEEWQRLKGGTIMFTADFFLLNQQNKNQLFELTFLDNTYAQPDLKPSQEDFAEIRNTIDLLVKERKRTDGNTIIVQSLLQVLLQQVQRSIDTSSSQPLHKRYIVIFKQLMNLIEREYKNGWKVHDYAAALNISQHHLSVVSNAVSGKNATALIRERELLEAKRMLTFSDYTISEISAALGYYDSSYFARIFKREVGCSPVAFNTAMSEIYRRS